MAKLNLPDIGSLSNAGSAKQAINDNFDAIEAALDNTISRDGSLPNSMAADLDLDDHKVINVADPVDGADAVNLRSIGPLVDAHIGTIAETIIEGTRRCDIFTATAGQTVFTLTDSPGTATSVIVHDGGIHMTPNVDYTISGATLRELTFFDGRALNSEIVARYEQLAPTDSVLRGDLEASLSNRGSSIVTFKPSLASTVSRSVASKLDDQVSILDFIPTNMHAAIRNKTSTANHTAYIQAAIDCIGGLGGGVIDFPAGLYNISATLDIPYNGVWLRGRGGGYYSATSIATTRGTAATRIAWVGGVPGAGIPMVDFRTPSTGRAYGRGGMSDIMLDGAAVAKIGVTLTSFQHATFNDVHVFGCLNDGFLLRTAAYTLAGGAGATQHNVFTRCAVTAFGESGVYLTNTCGGFRFTGAKFGTAGAVPTQSGDSSANSVYSPRFDLAKGTAIVFESVGQNHIYSPQGGAWAGATSGYSIIFGSTDIDSNWLPSGGITNAKAGVARYNTVWNAEHAILAAASSCINGGASFGNMVWGLSMGNACPLPVYGTPVNNNSFPELYFQTLGNSIDPTRSTLGGFVEVIGYDNSAAINPALFLKKVSDQGQNGDGLAKIQWRMTNAGGTSDVDAGRINAIVTNAVAGSETCAIHICPQVGGNGEAESCMGFQNGAIMPAIGGGVTLAYQGFGTINVNDSYWVDNVKVLGNRVAGWNAPSGTQTRGTFNSATATTAQCAQAIAALIADLRAHGIIGT